MSLKNKIKVHLKMKTTVSFYSSALYETELYSVRTLYARVVIISLKFLFKNPNLYLGEICGSAAVQPRHRFLLQMLGSIINILVLILVLIPGLRVMFPWFRIGITWFVLDSGSGGGFNIRIHIIWIIPTIFQSFIIN